MKTIIFTLAISISLVSASIAQNITFWGTPTQNSKPLVANKYLAQAEHIDIWDSVTLSWNNIANMSYEYNTKGKTTSKIYSDKNNKDIQKETYTYDHVNNMTSMIFSMKDTITNTWSPKVRNTITYFKDQFETINQNEIWDKNSNTWKLIFRNTKLYTPQNDIYLLKIEQINNTDTNITLGEKTDYIYDTENRKTEAIVIKYNPNIKRWDSSFKANYSYYSNGLLKDQIVALYDTTQATWIIIRKQSYTYDSQDTLIQVHTFQYNPIDETWINRELYDNIKWLNWNKNIDDQDNIASYVYKNWSDINNDYDTTKTYQKIIIDNFGSYKITTLAYINQELVPEQEFLKILDDQKNKLYYQIKNGVNGQWSNFYEEKSEYTYGNNKELLERLDWNFNFNVGALEKQSLSRFENFLVLGLPQVKKNKLTIFPNPSSGEITIKADDIEIIEIYNLSGQKILEEKIQNQKTKLNLAKGIYTIKLLSKTSTQFEKLIIN